MLAVTAFLCRPNVSLWVQPGTLLAAMVLSIVAANAALPVAIMPYLSLGTPIIAGSFFVNQVAHRRYGRRFAERLVWLGFAIALGLSLLCAPRRIALASATAFLCGQLLDVALFARWRHGLWWRAPLLASLAATTLDTVLFFGLAFVGSQTVWWHFAAADWLCKNVVDVTLLLPFRYISSGNDEACSGPPAPR